MPTELELLLDVAGAAVARGAGLIRAGFHAPAGVRRKDDGSPVTATDVAVEEALRAVLRAATPRLGIQGEELAREGPADRWVLDPLDGTKNFVDGLPFVATLLALVRGGRVDLGVVHAPLLEGGRGRSWWAVRGGGAFTAAGVDLRSSGAQRLRVRDVHRLEDAFLCHGGLRHFLEQGLWAGLQEAARRCRRSRGFGDWWGHMLVAEGRCDAMVDPLLKLHDIAAPGIIVEEAGGAVQLDPRLEQEGGAGWAISAAPALVAPLVELFRPSG